MGLFGVSETLSFEVPQFVRTLRENPKPFREPVKESATQKPKP